MRAPFALFLSTVAAVTLAASGGEAQTASNPIVYDAISGYEVMLDQYASNPPRFAITGVLHGQSATTTATYFTSNALVYQACERTLIQMANRPGRFALTMTPIYAYGVYTSVSSCALNQR